MQTVGEVLKKARLRKKLSLQAISQQTKIRPEYLSALEKDRYQDLPSTAHTQGFIKNYSQVVGLKVEPLLAIFRRDHQERAKAVFPTSKSFGFYWTPRLTFIFLLLLGLLVFLAYLFWQFRLLQQSPY